MNTPLHTPRTNTLATSSHTWQSHSNYVPHAGAASAVKRGDQIKKMGHRKQHVIMPHVCKNDNDHSRLWGNLSTCVLPWDDVLLHVIIVNRDTPFPKMLSHQTLNNLYQYATTEQVLIRDDGHSFVCYR